MEHLQTAPEQIGIISIVQLDRIFLKELNLELSKEKNGEDESENITFDNSELYAFELIDTTTNKKAIFNSSKNISLFLTSQRRVR